MSDLYPHSAMPIGSRISMTVKLASPLVVSQLGQMTMILVDTFMVGHLGAAALGGVGLGSSLFWVLALFGVGALMSLDYFVSSAHGKEDLRECHHWLWQSLYFCLLLSVPFVLALRWLVPGYLAHSFPQDIAVPAAEFVESLTWSLPPYLVFVAFRQYLQGMGNVNPATVITVCAIFSNLFFNWLFIFGHCGMSAMGVAGAGWATTVSRVLMAGALIAYTFYRDRTLKLGLSASRKSFDPRAIGELFRLGAPAGLQLALETGVFSLTAVLISKLGAVQAASHTIVVNIATFTYMIPLGLSGATAVLVGNQMGKGDSHEARVTGWASILLGVAVMAISGVVLCLFGRHIAGLFTEDADVVRLSSQLILLVALFQIADGIQSVGSGALRGLGDTRSSMLANLVGYWVVGLPLGYMCAFWLGLNAIGVWMGLTLGLFVVAAVILKHWWQHSSAEPSLSV